MQNNSPYTLHPGAVWRTIGPTLTGKNGRAGVNIEESLALFKEPAQTITLKQEPLAQSIQGHLSAEQLSIAMEASLQEPTPQPLRIRFRQALTRGAPTYKPN